MWRLNAGSGSVVTLSCHRFARKCSKILDVEVTFKFLEVLYTPAFHSIHSNTFVEAQVRLRAHTHSYSILIKETSLPWVCV